MTKRILITLTAAVAVAVPMAGIASASTIYTPKPAENYWTVPVTVVHPG